MPVIKVLEDAPSSSSAEEEEDMQSVMLKKTAGLLDLYRGETDSAGLRPRPFGQPWASPPTERTERL